LEFETVENSEAVFQMPDTLLHYQIKGDDTMEEKEKVFCPVNGWDCPYWRKDGQCGMIEDEGCHPREECDDYAMFDDFFEGL
jgi:hypothetical protein